MGGFEGIGYDRHLHHLQLMDPVRAMADQHAELAYMANPDEAWAAAQRARELAEYTCISFGADYEGSPAAATLSSAYSKLAFAFRNPSELGSSPSDTALADILSNLIKGSTITTGRAVELFELAIHLDIYASRVFLIREQQKGTAVDKMSPDDQLSAAHARYAAVAQIIIDA